MTNLNLVQTIRFYIDQMFKDSGQGPKALVMDNETSVIVNMAYAQADILQNEVFIFERINSSGKKTMKFVNGIYLIRPTGENIEILKSELQEPKYGNYFIYFTNFIDLSNIKALAESDEYGCVKVIHEFYADYLPVNHHLYSLNIPNTYQKSYKWDENILQRTVQGLDSLVYSLRRKRATIRYQKSSIMAEVLAHRLLMSLRRHSNSPSTDTNDSNSPVILILDRREDVVTPLLNQWTYQAMVHELLGIHKNRVNLSQVAGITKELEDAVLNAEYDEFYAKNLYNNFGDIASGIKELMEDYQEKHANQAKLESISDMRTFVSSFPEFKKLSGTVTKHVTIVSELSRLIGVYNLFEVSETEQNLVCQKNHNEIVQKIKSLISNKKVRDEDILRLLCLYALRYEHQNNNELDTFKREIQRTRRFPEAFIHFFHTLIEYGGRKFRQTDLFNTESAIAITKQFIRGIRDIENVYTQHIPLVKDLAEQLIYGKLKDTLYPIVGSNDQTKQNHRLPTNTLNQLSQQGQTTKPSEIIIYIIGGITYEESLHIHMMNNQGARILLGGSYIHNFTSFMEQVLAGSASTLPIHTNEPNLIRRR